MLSENASDLDPNLPLNFKSHEQLFLTKLYKILLIQCSFTSFLCHLTYNNGVFSNFVRQNFWVGIIFSLILIFSSLMIIHFPKQTKKYPYNFLMAGIFFFSEGMILSILSAYLTSSFLNFTSMMLVWVVIVFFTFKMFNKFLSFFKILPVALVFCFLVGFVYELLDISSFLNVGVWIFITGTFGHNMVVNNNLIMSGFECDLEVDDYYRGSVVFYLDSLLLFKRLLEKLKENKKE